MIRYIHLGWRPFAPALGLAAIMFVAGVAASFEAERTISGSEGRAQVRSVEDRADVMERAVEAETGRYIDAVRTIAAGIGPLDLLTADRFAGATEPLQNMQLSGATSITLVVPANDDEIGAVQSRWRARGSSGLSLLPHTASNEHYFGVLARSLDGSDLPPSGLDVAQAAAPTRALEEAKLTGNTTVSDAYQLLRDGGASAQNEQLSFVLVAPVYGVPTSTGTAPLTGWIVMGLRGQSFMGETLDEFAQGQVDVRVDARNAADDIVTVASLQADYGESRDIQTERTANVAQHRWRLTVDAAGPALAGGQSDVALLVLLLGLLVSLVLAALVFVLTSGRSKARGEVRVVTAELDASEHALHQQADVLHAIMSSLNDGVGVVDANGEFLQHNPAAKWLLGIENDLGDSSLEQEPYGMFRADGFTPFPPDELPLVRALANEPCDGVEMVIRNAVRPEGVLISVSGRPLDPTGATRGAIAVFHDITALRRQQEELESFAGVVAHDLKSPLTSIGGNIELAADLVEQLAGAEAAQVRDRLARVSAGVSRMTTLIDDLLMYTKARDALVNPNDCDLSSIAHDVARTRIEDAELSNGSTPVPSIAVGALPIVNADPVLIRQVIDNLVSNSIKYTAPGEPARIEISARRLREGWAYVEIADHGIGIPPGQHSAVFKRFHRSHVDAGYAGTGLGLAICQRVIERHGGKIGVRDNPEGGSRFWFTLPTSPSTRFTRENGKSVESVALVGPTSS